MASWAQTLAAGRDAPSRPVAVLPDLFLDHLVPLGEPPAVLDELAAVARRGGGNLHVPGQRLRLGGNAANVAHALARLGWPARLVAPTDALGRWLAEAELGNLPVDLAGVQDVGSASHTVALELAGEDGANVMLSDPGPLARLDPAAFAEAQLPRLRDAALVMVANWSKVARGTELLRRLVPPLAEARVPVVLDTSDPTPRGLEAARELLAEDEIMGTLAGWSLNAHEARWFARAAGAGDGGTLEAALRGLRAVTPARLDGHDAAHAVSLSGGDATRAPAFATDVVARTGAGDAWNAGNLLGGLLGLEDGDRLHLAHAVAALTIAEPSGRPPSLGETAAYLDARTPGPGRAAEGSG